jgi:hypothetical protein
MDICGTAAVNGATFVARTTTFDSDVTDLMVRALSNDGFSLVDVWELCTAYYAPLNKLNRTSMERLLASLSFPTGVLADAPGPEYSAQYRVQQGQMLGKEPMAARPFTPLWASDLERPQSLLFAGAAGKRIGAAAGAVARGGVLSGLWATQRNDYPVTVRTGFSLSEVILAPQEVLFTGIPAPDVVLDIFPEGHAKVVKRVRSLGPQALVYRNAALPEVETAARVVPIDFSRIAGWERKKESWMLMAAAAAIRDTGAYPLDALREAVGPAGQKAVEAGLQVGRQAPAYSQK